MRPKIARRNLSRTFTRLAGAGIIATTISIQSASLFAGDGVEINDVWARESPPTVTTGAVYMTIRDLSTGGDRLLSVTTDIAEKAELHTHEMVEVGDDDTGTHDMKDMKHGEKHEMKHSEMKHDTSKPTTMMRMRQVDSIEIPVDDTVSLQPGGLHVMLFDIAAPLKDQQSFMMTLTFEKAGAVPVTVLVKKPTP